MSLDKKKWAFEITMQSSKDGWYKVLEVGEFVNGNDTYKFTLEHLKQLANAKLTNYVSFVDLEHQESERMGDILEFRVIGEQMDAFIKWNDVGLEKLKVYKYVSPMIITQYDQVTKKDVRFIRSVALTNKPALNNLGEIEKLAFKVEKKENEKMEKKEKYNMKDIMTMLEEMMKSMGMKEKKDMVMNFKKEMDKKMSAFEKDEEETKMTSVPSGVVEKFKSLFQNGKGDHDASGSEAKGGHDHDAVGSKAIEAIAIKLEHQDKAINKILKYFSQERESQTDKFIQEAVDSGKIKADKNVIEKFKALYNEKPEEVKVLLQSIPSGGHDSKRFSVDKTVENSDLSKEEEEYLKHIGIDISATKKEEK